MSAFSTEALVMPGGHGVMDIPRGRYKYESVNLGTLSIMRDTDLSIFQNAKALRFGK